MRAYIVAYNAGMALFAIHAARLIDYICRGSLSMANILYRNYHTFELRNFCTKLDRHLHITLL